MKTLSFARRVILGCVLNDKQVGGLCGRCFSGKREIEKHLAKE